MRSSLFAFLFISLVLNMTSCSNKSLQSKTGAPYDFYIGTYTSDDSEGIYKATLKANGILSPTSLVAKTTDPSYLAISTSRKHILAVNEVEKGTVQSYRITDNGLSFINESSSGGIHPCHISVNKSGHIVTSNYTSGNVGLLHLEKNGEVSELVHTEQHTGSGEHPRQDGPHAHSTYFINDSDIVSVDLGTNDLWFSRLHKKDQNLEPTYKLQMKAKAGPRHLAIHPDKKTIVVVNELDCTISLLQKAKNHKYSIQQSASTLPTDYTDANTSADIHLSRDGKYAYVSNRGHNSIAILEINAMLGTIELIGHESTKGSSPRNFSLSPDDRYLLVANQKSNNIVSFKRDAATGMLAYIMETAVSTPVCILFE